MEAKNERGKLLPSIPGSLRLLIRRLSRRALEEERRPWWKKMSCR
jgi:hypothetical protein